MNAALDYLRVRLWNRTARAAILIAAGIVTIWLIGWHVGFEPTLLEGHTTQPLSDVFSSVNALFAGLAFGGVILTSYLQYRDLKEAKEQMDQTAQANLNMAEASVKMATHSDERAILDLFQTYCSEYFQVVKDSSMSVLIPCVASKEYCDFVISRFFVAEQLPFPEDCWEKVSAVSYCKTRNEFVQQEQRYRYKLDELINFFTLLTGRSDNDKLIERFDFSYSWWRPLLWMIATQQKKRYDANDVVRKYATPLTLLDVVRKLDASYGMVPFAADAEMWEFFVSHPKIQSYRLDPAYRQLAQQASVSGERLVPASVS